MTKGLSEKERDAIIALADASAEALHATVMELRAIEARRPRAKALGTPRTRL